MINLLFNIYTPTDLMIIFILLPVLLIGSAKVIMWGW